MGWLDVGRGGSCGGCFLHASFLTQFDQTFIEEEEIWTRIE